MLTLRAEQKRLEKKEGKGEKAQQELPESGSQNSLSVTNGTNDDSPSSGDELKFPTEKNSIIYVKPATNA